MFEPEFAEAVESGDMFFCEECHDFLCDSAEMNYCPHCHVGACMECGKPILPGNVGNREFDAPEYIVCKQCYKG